MPIKIVISCVSLSTLLLAVSAFGENSTIDGNAADDYGKPLKKATVRVQPESSNSAATVVQTDAKGHFVAANLSAGSYSVAVSVRGTVKWSAAHVKATKGKVTTVNLGGKQVAAAAGSQPKKRAVWVPDRTGSRLGGHWEDQPYRGPGGELDAIGDEQFRRMQNISGPPPATGGR